MQNSFLLGLDMGGTHTDAVVVHQGELLGQVKVCTNPNNLIQSSHAALSQVLQQAGIKASQISRLTLGTTLLVNALVQNKTASVGLLLSAGPGLNPANFALGQTWAKVQGGLDHRGQELVPVSSQEIKQILHHWQGLTNFACVGKFSPRNNQHELIQAQLIKGTIKQAQISLGHSFGGELNFPRRIATAYWNAALTSLQHEFATAIMQSLQQIGLNLQPRLLKADGGSLDLARSLQYPIEALISGPAASIMGMLAGNLETKDYWLLDIGGTTTDLAVLAQGQPILSATGLTIQGRPTLIRALQSLSIALGGDTLVKIEGQQIVLGPERLGPALAFGGQHPTLLDCLNVLKLAQAGAVEASYLGLQGLALSAETIAQEVVKQAKAKLKQASQTLLTEINQRPVYTLDALLHPQPVRPEHIILVGGPAEAMTSIVAEALNLPVTVPALSQVTNALGAALTRPTASLDLFADTLTKQLHIPSLGIQKTISKNYSLQDAITEATTLLKTKVQDWAGDLPIDITQAVSFSTLDGYDYGGKDLRVSCQIRPGLS